MRKRKRKGSLATYFYCRTVRRQDGTVWHQRISLGADEAEAKAQFTKYLDNPPPLEVEPEPGALTLGALCERWLAEYVAAKRIPRGREQAEQRMRDYLWPHLGAAPVSDLKPADIRALSATLEAQGVGLVTRRRLLEDLRCCLRYAVDEAEVLVRSPWKRGMLPTIPEQEPNPLSEVELAWAIRVAPERWRPVFTLAAATGLRWGELRAITWKDVREKPYPHLVVSKSHAGSTKSRKVREVPFLFETESVLPSLGRPADRAARLFPWLPEPTAWINRYVKRQSPVKDFHVHRLRHTFATRYLEAGGTLEGLQRILGHSTIKLTERYGRLRPHVVAAEAARINRAVSGTIAGTATVPQPSEARNSL